MAPRSKKSAEATQEEPEANQDEDTLDVLELDDGSLEDVQKPKDLPIGRYMGEVSNVQQKQGPKARYYSVTFVIPPEEYPAADADELNESYEDGVQLYWNRVMVPRSAQDRRSLFRVKQFMKALGLDTDVSKIDPNDWMGQKALLVVKMGEYQGEKRIEIARVEPAERSATRR